MIETNAITIGTTARNEANTNAEHGERAQRRPASPRARSPGPPESCAAVLGQRVEARSGAPAAPADRRAARARRSPPSPACGFSPNAESGSGVRVDDRERRAAVLRRGRSCRRSRRTTRAASRAAPAPASGRPALRSAFTCGESARRALRQRHDREQRRGVAAGAAVVLGDVDVGLPALLVGHGELGIEGVCGGSGGRDAGDRQDDPADARRCACGRGPSGSARTRRYLRGCEKKIVPRRNNLYHE